jgi:hypothetical protein
MSFTEKNNKCQPEQSVSRPKFEVDPEWIQGRAK